VTELPTAHIEIIPKIKDIYKENILTTYSVLWARTREYPTAGFQGNCMKV
jgi:hypothetical protein